MFHPKKAQYIDTSSFKLVEKLIEVTEETNTESQRKGSQSHKKVSVQITDEMLVAPGIFHTTIGDERIDIWESRNNTRIGFTEDNYPDFIKVVDAIYKEKMVTKSVSRDLIEKETFKYLTNIYKTKQASENLSTYLTRRIDESCVELRYYLLISNLEIEFPLSFKNVEIGFFTKDFFSSVIEGTNNGRPYSDGEKAFFEKYYGKVYISTMVKAEREKGKSIALEKCGLFIDVLKLCSDVTDNPVIRLGFDIDSRVKESQISELITTPQDDNLNVTFSSSFNSNVYHIDESSWKRINQRQLNDFLEFVNYYENKDSLTSELEDLIILGIQRYADAVSNRNLNQRVVDLFTILESNLLPNNSSPIIDSVKKYLSKLIFKNVDERKMTISLLGEMYDIRSALIHHGKNSKIELNKLRKLQYFVLMLLLKLIEKSKVHKTKSSLLEEIDDAIIGAY